MPADCLAYSDLRFLKHLALVLRERFPERATLEHELAEINRELEARFLLTMRDNKSHQSS